MWFYIRMEWLFRRCNKEAVFYSVFRAVLFMTCMLLVLSLYSVLWSVGVQLHSAFTGSYVPGYHSVLLINSPNENAANDIARAIMERRLAASINILSRTSTMYYWKGEIQEASEILMLVKTKTSRIKQVIEYVRSVHPYANPEVLSFRVEDSSLAYMKWMDEAISDD
ncbi:protein CutA homolog [Micropterus salmoides]|uniref:protein CutA homolog n=1 Tax=Micropterus salmoides TaxID=27706 RepID=UPI0018EC3F59|nr:protein CutA homolog [Micropterus salmoides]XP_045923023.1 protein CutA homolog isoform X2 [Micropterus dolomieu]